MDGVLTEHEFLDLFSGNICFVTLDDTRKDPTLRHYHEGFKESRQEILSSLYNENKSKNHRGVYFCVNEIDRNLDLPRKRTESMVTRFRAIFLDDDIVRDGHRDDFRLKPSIIVESSPGKYHYYWLINLPFSEANAKEWDKVMITLIDTYDGDPACKDRVRILRVPKFKHLKGKPFISRVVVDNSIRYNWDIIKGAFPPSEHDRPTIRLTKKDGTTERIRLTNFKIATDLIRTGQNYHDAIRYLGLHYSNLGMSGEETLSIIQTLMETCEVKDDRWSQRCDQLEENLKDWVKFVEDSPLETTQFVITDEKEYSTNLSFPPGLMGELCKQFYDMAPHPNEEIAISGAFTLVSGIIGRVVNINGMGLNLYITLVAESGLGKESAITGINRALTIPELMSQGIQIFPEQSPTAEKGLVKLLHEYPSRIIVDDEAGISGQSKAGDQATLRAAKLKMYSTSAKGSVYTGKQYSADRIPFVNAPCLSVLSVSTPAVYAKLLSERDAARTGELNRMWMIESKRPKTYLNRNMLSEFAPHIKERIQELVLFSHQINNVRTEGPAQPTVINMDTDTVPFFEDNDKWTDIANEATDPITAHVANRAHAKIAKISAVASFFNNPDSKLGMEEYKWATEVMKIELRAAPVSMVIHEDKDLYAVVRYKIIPVIKKVMSSTKSERLSNQNCFRWSPVQQLIRYKCKPHATTFKTGEEVVLDYMIREGLIRNVDFNKDKVLCARMGVDKRNGKVLLLSESVNTF